jgi:peptide/nickel transport system permease protein
MSIDAEIAVGAPVSGPPPESPDAPIRARRARIDGGLWVSLAVLLVLLLIGFIGPLLLPFDPASVSLLDRLKPPGSVLADGSVAWLGTDALGQSLTTLMVNGLRTSLVVAGAATIVAAVVGVALGVIAGYSGKWVDAVVSRVVEIVLVFPAILLAIVIAGLLGPSILNLILVLAVTRWVVFTRVTRASTLSLRERDWVKSSRVLGVASPLIVLRHILPFLIGPLATVATLEFAAFVMAEASLSFLGIGLPASAVSLGKTISEGRDHLVDAYWITTYPGLLLVILVVTIGLLGDSLSHRFGKVR